MPKLTAAVRFDDLSIRQISEAFSRVAAAASISVNDATLALQNLAVAMNRTEAADATERAVKDAIWRPQQTRREIPAITEPSARRYTDLPDGE